MDASSSSNTARTSPALRLAGGLQAVAERPDPAELEALQSDARALLAALKVDRARIEARLAEFGRTDPIVEVKGHSALDEAIERCQAAILRLDDMLGQR
ncbi:MAG TPA: hypothetical protein DCX60_06270 [Phycisphaerales bacterium]|nr:hypothetical protein [Phycisphaerales bacterium]